MRKNIYIILVVLFLFAPVHVFAQSATQSAESTQSAQASQSADATDSATATASSLPSELPQTGAADVFILTAAGLIFIFAAFASLRAADEVFSEIRDE